MPDTEHDYVLESAMQIGQMQAEPRNTVTIGVTATEDSTSDRREEGVQVRWSGFSLRLTHWV
jgi:arginase family enzyme